MPTTTTSSAARPGYFADEPTEEKEEVLLSQQNLHAAAQTAGPVPTMPESRPPVANVWKGKGKALNQERPTTMLGEDRPREYRSSWTINGEIANVGADSWIERDRVILILGRESATRLLRGAHD